MGTDSRALRAVDWRTTLTTKNQLKPPTKREKIIKTYLHKNQIDLKKHFMQC